MQRSMSLNDFWVNAMQLSFGMFKLGALSDHTMKSVMPPAKCKENVTSTSA